MAAFANLVLADGQNTPVNHTFIPGPAFVLPDKKTGRWIWHDFGVNSGLPIGANVLSMDVRMPQPGGRNRPARAGDPSSELAVSGMFRLPTLEVLSNNTSSGIQPQPTHAYDTTIWWKVVRNGRSGQGSSKDAIAFTRNFFASAVFTDALLGYAPPAN